MGVSIITISSFLAIFSLVAWMGYNNFTNLADRRTRNLQAFEGVPPFPKTFDLEPVVDVPLPLYSCFLACARADPKGTDLTCHFREDYRKQIIGKVILDGNNFQIQSHIDRDAVQNNKRGSYRYSDKVASITKDALSGEDPRTFLWDGELYVINNRGNRGTLFQVGEHGSKYEFPLPLFLGKKNITPVPMSSGGLMFIDFQEKNVNVCVRTGEEELDLSCEPYWKEVLWGYKQRKNFNFDEWYHRGGTNGFEVSPGVFVGFGHMTNKNYKQIHHDIWYWMLDTRPEKAYFFNDHVVMNHNLDNIVTDPTSILHIGGEWYLFTAESNTAWSSKISHLQFTNRIYRIKSEKCAQFGYCKQWP